MLKVALNTKALTLFKYIRYKPVTTTAGDFDSCTCLIYTVYMQLYVGIIIKENRQSRMDNLEKLATLGTQADIGHIHVSPFMQISRKFTSIFP